MEKNKGTFFKKILGFFFLLFSISTVFSEYTGAVEINNHIVNGVKYTFSPDNDFTLNSGSESQGVTETLGSVIVEGNISNIDNKNGLPTYSVSSGNLKFYYKYDGTQYSYISEDEEHFDGDNSDKIDEIKLGRKMGKGALIIQTSKDGRIWFDIDEKFKTDFFNESSATEAVYETTDIQLLNGCYYRIIVAYRTTKRIEDRKLLGDRYESKRYMEVFTFHAIDEKSESIAVPGKDRRYELGSAVRTEKTEGYTGIKEMTNKDPHFGWNLGQFFVGGFTDYDDDKEIPVFLKNSGDRISLWFNLLQNIDMCYGNKDIRVEADKRGSDSYFGVPGGIDRTMDFGRGTLILRKINPDNTKDETKIYTDYLEACASPDAETKVDLLEEGDYEVALDYKLIHSRKVSKITVLNDSSSYRIFFRFSVRNANSMVFIFDSRTGSEIANGSVTPDGFRLDYAGSRYLKTSVKKEVLKDGDNNITEDTRFNSSAKDGDIFTEEGIYTVTVRNLYSGRETEKKIYIGKDKILISHLKTGYSVREIRNMIKNGAIINEDGTITELQNENILSNSVNRNIDNNQDGAFLKEGVIPTSQQSDISGKFTDSTVTDKNKDYALFIITAALALLIISAGFIIMRKWKLQRNGGEGIK